MRLLMRSSIFHILAVSTKRKVDFGLDYSQDKRRTYILTLIDAATETNGRADSVVQAPIADGGV